MTVITEAELRQWWQGGRGAIPPLPSGARLTPSACDFVAQWGLALTFTDDRPQTADREPESEANSPLPLQDAKRSRIPASSPPFWDKPAEFPVNLSGPLPACIVCGQPVTQKPAHMAQIDAAHFAPKTSPRFMLRGKMDTLHAQFLLAITQARRYSLPELGAYLTTLAAYCREITSAEYHDRPVSPLQLAGLSEAQIREASHWPDRVLGIAHVIPGSDDHEMMLQLNLLRCQTREAELVAAAAVTGPDGQPTRTDLMTALNRLSSAVYYLILLFKAGKITWQMPKF